MDDSDSQPVDNSSAKKYQQTWCILASCYHVRLTLMYYIILLHFWKKRETWNNLLEKVMQKGPLETNLFDYGGLLWKNKTRCPIVRGFGQENYALGSFTGQQ